MIESATETDTESRQEASRLRFFVYVLLVVTSLGSLTARICTVKDKSGKTPFLSANDRSRWSTIRCLVEDGTYVIDEIHEQRGWNTIDKVNHVGRDDQAHFYSSKPPLFPTMLAAEYWLVKQVIGVSIVDQPFYVGRVMLILTNGLTLLLLFALLLSMVERLGCSDWGRLFVAAFATWGTYLTTFGVTLNNHLPAALSVIVALYFAWQIWYEGNQHWWQFAIAGLAAAFAAANELPALSFLCLLGLGMLIKDAKRACLFFAPAALIVVAGFFVTNYVAHESWRPPYTHRGEGDNWYAYKDTHWSDENRKGIDAGEVSRATYTFNSLIGHHGVFSLTPVLAFSWLGLALWMFGGRGNRRSFAVFVAVLSIVCFSFYMMRPLLDRNYGGMTSGFRWMFWFIPMWTLTLVPAADWMARHRLTRVIGYFALAVSVFSATYPAMNPWTHPWLYQYWQYLGWL